MRKQSVKAESFLFRRQSATAGRKSGNELVLLGPGQIVRGDE